MRILCLANSFKEGGRCLAGIQLDSNNNPVIRNNRPVWIRPICNTEHGQVPNHLCSNISTLDIMEIQNASINGTGYQSENTIFDSNSINIVGRAQVDNLENLVDNNTYNSIFGNNWNAVYESWIHNINYSLMLISTRTFQIIERQRDDRVHPQIRLSFDYNGSSYDLPITDPNFLTRYQRDSSIVEGVDMIYVVLSLGVVFNEKYYKLVAAIIY